LSESRGPNTWLVTVFSVFETEAETIKSFETSSIATTA
jgi:hypothetical protein